MKKFLAILSILFLCAACTYENEPTPVTETTGTLSREMFERIYEFKYKGHQYIWFRSLNGGYAGWDGGIVHNPDCECGYYRSDIEYD